MPLLEFANGEQADSEIHISKDFGKTWTEPGVQAGQEQDRQWFAHTPDGKRQFLVYHDFVAEGEFYVESDDGGKSWGNPVLINDLSQAMTPPGRRLARSKIISGNVSSSNASTAVAATSTPQERRFRRDYRSR